MRDISETGFVQAGLKEKVYFQRGQPRSRVRAQEGGAISQPGGFPAPMG